jgi:hypothetical protein
MAEKDGKRSWVGVAIHFGSVPLETIKEQQSQIEILKSAAESKKGGNQSSLPIPFGFFQRVFFLTPNPPYDFN